jgi:hypothetical protein
MRKFADTLLRILWHNFQNTDCSVSRMFAEDVLIFFPPEINIDGKVTGIFAEALVGNF